MLSTIYTSYFYQVRFLPSNFLPLSTAKWDPKWYHDFKGEGNVYVDKRGIVNGLRLSQLTPGKECENLCKGSESCSNSPNSCRFLEVYREQVNKLDMEQFLSLLTDLTELHRDLTHLNETNIVLLFHEVPTNPCSERVVVTDWLTSNGIQVKEFNRRN